MTAVYVAEGAERDGRLREIFRMAADRGISLLEVPRPSSTGSPTTPCTRGWRRRCRRTSTPTPTTCSTRPRRRGEPALIVALDSVTDPRNLGAVVRRAAGFGAHGVLVPERRSAGMTPSAWKTSAGAAARVPVAQAMNLTRQLKAYQEAGCMVVGLAADGDVSLPDLDLADGPLVLVVGSEGDGLSRLVAETCDQLVSIPMASGLESLNAGVAAAVALYAIAQTRAHS